MYLKGYSIATYKNDSLYIHSCKYTLVESGRNYTKTLESKDSSVRSLNDELFTEYDWLLAAGNESDIMGSILSKKETKNPPQVFDITYCQTGDCLEENILELSGIPIFIDMK